MDNIDNSFSEDSKPFRRFYLNRIKDETGISRTGRVLEAAVMQDGKVVTQWRPPHSTIGIYNSMKEFMTIHVDCHPSCNEVVWIDDAAAAKCLVCGDEEKEIGEFASRGGHCSSCISQG